jgi:hypothetical protein
MLDMRPRSFLTAGLELQQIGEALRQAYPLPQKKRRHFGPDLKVLLYLGLYLALLFVVLLLAWSPTADPLGDAKLNNAPRSAASPTPTTHQQRVNQLGDTFLIPDKQHIAIYVGDQVHWEDLPWTGNHIGDARYVWDVKRWYIWLVPAESEDGTPTWTDPWHLIPRYYIGECLALQLPDGQFVYPILRGWVDDWRNLPKTGNQLDNDAWIDHEG